MLAANQIVYGFPSCIKFLQNISEFTNIDDMTMDNVDIPRYVNGNLSMMLFQFIEYRFSFSIDLLNDTVVVVHNKLLAVSILMRQFLQKIL